MTYLHHITITTGHSRRCLLSEVAPEVLAMMGEWLSQALLSDDGLDQPPVPVPLPVPALAEFSAHVHQSPGGLVVTVYGPDILTVPPAMPEPVPLVTFAVARRERNAAKLWSALILAAQGPLAPPAMPSTPWCGVVLHQGVRFFPDATNWLGDFERCVAWAWILRVAD